MNLKKRIRSKIYSTDPYADWDANLKSIFIHFVKLFLFKSLSICNKDKSLLVFVSNCGWINIPSEHALPKIKHEHPNYDSILPKFTKHLSRYFKSLIVLDIGANIGDTAVTMINNGGVKKVICVEPCMYFYKILCKNKFLYKLETINCFINNDSNISLQIQEDDRGNAIISNSCTNSSDNHCNVRTIDNIYESLSNKDKKDLKFIKIDIEGYDINALESAKKTVINTNSSVFFEIYPYLINSNTKRNAADIIHLLKELSLFHLCIFDGWGTLISLFDIRTTEFNYFFEKLFSYSSQTMDIWFDGLAVNDKNLSILKSFIDENKL